MHLSILARRRLLLTTCGSLLALVGGCVRPDSTTTITPAILGQADVRWLQRAAFGLDSATLESYRTLGRQRWLDRELADRSDTLPPAVSALIASYPALNTPPAELLDAQAQARRELKAMPDGDARVAARKALQQHARELGEQAQQAELLHAIYGSNPLKEQLVWFWLNHFSVYAAKGDVRLYAAHYAEQVIRPHALGRFRDLVLATLQSPAMLEFLDNAKNVKGKTNENYARELMELHTLGVGSGYTQQDVQALALILTGAGVVPPASGARRPGESIARPQGTAYGRKRAPAGARRGVRRDEAGWVREGLFVFNPRKHDFSDKQFLGHTIRGSGYPEIEQAVTLITRQPACARFISRQLAEYFVADQPPPALVDAMAQTFQRTDGDIAAVLRTLFDSPAALAGPAQKFKDPMRFLVSAMQLTYDGRPIRNARPLLGWLNQMGEPVFGRLTPDGWPLDGGSWSGSGQMATRFAVARAIGSGGGRLFAADDDGQPMRANRMPRTPAPDLDGPLFAAAFAPYLSAPTRAALAKAGSAAEWNTYLLSSPDFNYR
ncbi:MAG: DUF1800 domain-containing protein [Xanthomonadales bacterium]|nr:DUF1800 domain-containing protein [Xanthomonadales bacterium]